MSFWWFTLERHTTTIGALHLGFALVWLLGMSATAGSVGQECGKGPDVDRCYPACLMCAVYMSSLEEQFLCIAV